MFEPQGNAVFNDDDSMLRAALQGVGLVRHIDLCVRQHLDSGALMRVLAPWCHPFPGFFLYVPSRAQMPAKIGVLMDFLMERCEQLAPPQPRRFAAEDRRVRRRHGSRRKSASDN